MRLSGAAWYFVGATLRESVEIYRALQINAIDVLALPGFLLDSDKIIENPSHTALAIKELGVPVVNLMFNFAGNFSDRALNHKDESIRRRNIAEFHAVVEFCRQAEIPSVTMLPGVRQDGWPASKALEMSGEALDEMARIGRTLGVRVFF